LECPRLTKEATCCRLQAVQRGQVPYGGMPEPPEMAHRRVSIGGPGGGNTFRPLDEISDDHTDNAGRLPSPRALKLPNASAPSWLPRNAASNVCQVNGNAVIDGRPALRASSNASAADAPAASHRPAGTSAIGSRAGANTTTGLVAGRGPGPGRGAPTTTLTLATSIVNMWRDQPEDVAR
jgi:hypothetical protein